MNDKIVFSASAVRAEYLKRIKDYFTEAGEEVLLIKSGT